MIQQRTKLILGELSTNLLELQISGINCIMSSFHYLFCWNKGSLKENHFMLYTVWNSNDISRSFWAISYYFWVSWIHSWCNQTFRSEWVCEALLGRTVPILYPCHVCYTAFPDEKSIKDHFRWKWFCFLQFFMYHKWY